MSNEIKIFENEEFGSVRTLEINGKPYFVGKDVTDILGYQNGSRDITAHNIVPCLHFEVMTWSEVHSYKK